MNVGRLQKVWVPFKYESLPRFCFGCEHLRHNLKECDNVAEEEKNRSEDE